MKQRVGIFMGGPSAEHDVSLNSGLQVLMAIDRTLYDPIAVVITRDLSFFYSAQSHAMPEFSDLTNPQNSSYFKAAGTARHAQDLFNSIDVAFLALHGTFGEDGVIQGFFNTLKIPYTGSGVYASSVAMNKITTKFLFIEHGLITPDFSVYGKNYPAISVDTIIQKHGFPCFVKCPQSGSSRLMGRADTKADLKKMLGEFSRESDDILIETMISGNEYSCPVLQMPDGTLDLLPPVEIRPVASSYFDYEAKYSQGGSQEIVPAPCSAHLSARLQETARIAHVALGCQGLSRTDMIVANNTIYTLEINTLPGMTSTSLAPKSFAAAGGTYQALVTILIQSACAKKTLAGVTISLQQSIVV